MSFINKFKLSLLVGCFFILSIPAYAKYDPSGMGSMMISDVNNNMSMGLLKLNKLGKKDRLLFGNEKDYKKLNVKFVKKALADARIYIIRAEDGSALLRINSIRRIKEDFDLVLKDPANRYLYSWKIRKYSKGQFEARLNQTMNYQLIKSMPRTGKIPKSMKTIKFPTSPQPIFNLDKASQAKKSKTLANRFIKPVNVLFDDGGLLEFASLASKILPDILMTKEDGVIRLRQVIDTVALLNPHNLDHRNTRRYAFKENREESLKAGQLKHVGYKVGFQNSNALSPFFGWTKQIVYRVEQNDMSLDSIIKNSLVDKTLSVDAIMAATYKINKKSFGSSSLYLLRKGSILHMPPYHLIKEMEGNPRLMTRILREATGTTSVY